MSPFIWIWWKYPKGNEWDTNQKKQLSSRLTRVLQVRWRLEGTAVLAGDVFDGAGGVLRHAECVRIGSHAWHFQRLRRRVQQPATRRVVLVALVEPSPQRAGNKLGECVRISPLNYEHCTREQRDAYAGWIQEVPRNEMFQFRCSSTSFGNAVPPSDNR